LRAHPEEGQRGSESGAIVNVVARTEGDQAIGSGLLSLFHVEKSGYAKS